MVGLGVVSTPTNQTEAIAVAPPGEAKQLMTWLFGKLATLAAPY
jgi:hypothetical protein